MQRFELGIQNTDAKPERFSISGRHWEMDQGKIAKYKAEVCVKLRQLQSHSSADVEAWISKPFPRTSPRHAHICGKFLLAMLFHYLRYREVISNVTLDSLTYRLATNCKLRGLRTLGRQIGGYLRQGGVEV